MIFGDMISQIGERPDNPVIALAAIFPGHANNQSVDALVNSRSAGTSPRLRSIEFASNEPVWSKYPSWALRPPNGNIAHQNRQDATLSSGGLSRVAGTMTVNIFTTRGRAVEQSKLD
jgi:hypothetical protein